MTDTELPATSFGDVLLQQVFDLWVMPVVAERGRELTALGIRKAIVEMEPEKPIRVFVNDEAEINGWAKANRDIAAGEEVTTDDIGHLERLEPIGIGANSGWVCFVRIGEQAFVAFDLVYNRARATALVAKARRFHSVSATAFAAGDWDVAVDTGYSAAELTIQAEMLSMHVNTKSHAERGRWIRGWAGLDNAPKHHADSDLTLHSLRAHARYSADDIRSKVTEGTLRKALKTVVEMIEVAERRLAPQYSGPPL